MHVMYQIYNDKSHDVTASFTISSFTVNLNLLKFVNITLLGVIHKTQTMYNFGYMYMPTPYICL